MKRYASYRAYLDDQGLHPGFPSDYATVNEDGRSWRLMVMSDSKDVLLEEVGGECSVLGRVHEPEVVDAVLDPLWAQAELDERRLTLTEVVAAVASLPEDAEAEQTLVDLYRARQERSDALLKDGRRRSYAVLPIAELTATSPAVLHRKGQVDYDDVDWRKVSKAARDYLEQGHDPTNAPEVREHGYDTGLSDAEVNWLESLFVDPICLGESGYVNGRHRTEAIRAQGVTHLVVDTRSAMAEARRKALLVRAGAPVLELAPVEAAPLTPRSLTPAELEPTHSL